jgi:excisionase family DNA binding protein
MLVEVNSVKVIGVEDAGDYYRFSVEPLSYEILPDNYSPSESTLEIASQISAILKPSVSAEKEKEDEPLTVVEAARFLRVKVSRLYSWTHLNYRAIPYTKVGNSLRFCRAELTDWINDFHSRRLRKDNPPKFKKQKSCKGKAGQDSALADMIVENAIETLQK